MPRPARRVRALALALVLAGLPALVVPARAQEATPLGSPAPLPALSANASVFATGLDNPRGLRFGPDGRLYVAEGGRGGTTSTDGQCPQVAPPVGPYTGGDTARISTLDVAGTRTTLIDGLPSNQTSAAIGSEVSGVADVAFVGDTLYYLLAGGGCSHGHPDVPNGVFRLDQAGKPVLVADLSAFVKAHPVAKPNPGDFEPDEGPYAMALLNGQLAVTEANHGAIDQVNPDGTIARLIDLSATEGHVVPTGIAVGPDGTLYVDNLTPSPYPDGAAVLYRITPEGKLAVAARGLTAALAVAFDAQGQLYALETSTGNTQQPPFMVPGSGRVVRLEADGSWTVVATGLTFPTGMTVGPDGALYVANFGFGFPPGAGQVVKIDLSAPLPAATSGRTPRATPALASPAA